MKLSRRMFLGILPLVPGAAKARALGNRDWAFADIARQIGGVTDVSPYLIEAAEYEFVLAYGPDAKRIFVTALDTGPLLDRIADAEPALQAQAAFVATFLYTGEVVRDGVTSAKYYPWCLSWKAVTFASAPGTCGGPGFGHWENAPIPGAM
ncbi:MULTISPECIES: hypothetical protein [Neorhizobium]|jgi:hypothetical protein|uniref:hypothetical protein n=1 Tax=Neorhizobium TaxID=1525371 RepID=UPI000CF98756|nr:MULTISPECIES: hypothetical protein [Neorhizobium]